MGLSNELCSEIAVALLVTRDKSDLELMELKEIVFQVQAALQQMTEVERAAGDRLRSPGRTESSVYKNGTGSGEDSH